MGDRRAERLGEGLLSLVVEVMLVPEKQHLVLAQRRLDRLDRRPIKRLAQLHPLHFRSDPAGDRL